MTMEEIERKATEYGIDSSAWNLIEEILADRESREKKLTSRLDNAKKRYESKCQELDDCSAFSTKQALEINDFESKTCENCENYQNSICWLFVTIEGDEPSKDFGCLKFERIEL